MKRIYLLLVVTALLGIFVSCNKPSTVQFVNNVTHINNGGNENGTLYSVTLLLYQDNEVVGQVNIGDVTGNGGKSDVLEIENYVEKVKVMFQFFPSSVTVSNPYYYTTQFYLITSDDDNIISINDQTMVSGNLKQGSLEKEISKY